MGGTRPLNANQPRRGNELDTCNYILRKYVISGTFVRKSLSLTATPSISTRQLYLCYTAVHSFRMILSYRINFHQPQPPRRRWSEKFLGIPISVLLCCSLSHSTIVCIPWVLPVTVVMSLVGCWNGCCVWTNPLAAVEFFGLPA